VHEDNLVEMDGPEQPVKMEITERPVETERSDHEDLPGNLDQ
jgi:hypothetical protein